MLLALVLLLLLMQNWWLRQAWWRVMSSGQEGRQVGGDVRKMLLLLPAGCDDRLHLRCTMVAPYLRRHHGCRSSQRERLHGMCRSTALTSARVEALLCMGK